MNAAAAGRARQPPSIRGRLMRALLVWSLVWCSALGAAVWLAVREEVHELMDDSLQSAAQALIGPLMGPLMTPPQPGAGPPLIAPAAAGDARFVWQLVGHGDGARVLAAAAGAPPEPLQGTPSAGFSERPGWRIYGQPVGRDGQMLYVAQTRDERGEAEAEVAFAVLLAGLPMSLLALLWLGAKVRDEMQPLQALSARLGQHDPLAPGATLGEATRAELVPVHDAIDALAARLAQRVARERAFSAHAAHALRTPLAGIDAQLAVALRDAPPPLQQRLARVRAATGRLQRVVVALLALFRSAAEVQRENIELAALAARVPVDGLTIEVSGEGNLPADADLLTAALLNLLDNALRHGARAVRLASPAPAVLRVHDDGPGVSGERRAALQQALDAQDYAGSSDEARPGGLGLGLVLTDLVARAHGGRLVLPPSASGFVAEMRLQAP